MKKTYEMKMNEISLSYEDEKTIFLLVVKIDLQIYFW